MDKSLKDRIALVTGVSRRIGIGAAICRALAQDGIDIFLTYFRDFDRNMPWGADEEGPLLLKKELQECGVRCKSLELDLSLPDSHKKILDSVEQQLGIPSILINNAAYSTHDGYEGLTAEILDAHYKVNMRATFLLSTEFIKRFKKENLGRIVNLTSGQSLGSMPGEIAYAATKGAIEVFTRSLSQSVAKLGITVNAVNPGPTDTGWMSEELKKELLPHFPQGRLGKPEDVANLISFLVSDKASWITGQVIHSEGGFIR